MIRTIVATALCTFLVACGGSDAASTCTSTSTTGPCTGSFMCGDETVAVTCDSQLQNLRLDGRSGHVPDNHRHRLELSERGGRRVARGLRVAAGVDVLGRFDDRHHGHVHVDARVPRYFSDFQSALTFAYAPLNGGAPPAGPST